jgi:hypothetical protein
MCCEGRGQGEGRMTGWQRDRVTRGHWDKETTGMRVRPCEGTLTMRHERRWCQIISPCLRHECLSCGRGHGAIAPGEVEKEAANANTWVRWEETFVRYKKITECRQGDKETGRQRDRVTRSNETVWFCMPCLRHECLSYWRGHGAIAPGEVETKAANANTWVRWEETFVRYKKITECRRGDGATKRPCDKEQRDCMVLYAMPLAWMPLLLESPRCNSTGWGRNESGKCEYMSKIRKEKETRR